MYRPQQIEFTGARSAARVRLLQAFTSSPRTPYTLFVPGPDGAAPGGDEDPLSQAVAKYLLRGDFGAQLDHARGPQVISDPRLEDMFLGVGAEGVDVYRPVDFVPGAGKLMARWPSTTQLRPPRALKDDTFQCEEFKVRAFLRVLRGKPRLGFTQDAEAIERWPLVQAHALEEMGAGGFLTQKHAVTSVHARVAAALAYVDAHTADGLARKNADMLAYHWRTLCLVLDKPKTPWRRLELSEADLAEPLTSFYDFGNMNQRGGAAPPSSDRRGARVLLGTRSETLFGVGPADDADAQAALVGTAGPGGGGGGGEHPALHFTIEGDDASSGVRAARTYLLSSLGMAVLPKQQLAADEDDEEAAAADGEAKEAAAAEKAQEAVEDTSADFADGKKLVRMYGLLCRGMQALVQRGGRVCTRTALVQAVGDDLASLWADALDHLEVSVSDLGATATATTAARHLRFVRVALRAIPSGVAARGVLGAIVVGDTIVVDHNAPAGTAAFNLNAGIPYLRTWVCARDEGQSVVDVKRAVSREHIEIGLGAALHDAELRRTQLVFGGDDLTAHALCPSLTGAACRFFARGLLLTHNGEGACCLLFGRHVSDVRLVESEAGASSLLALTLTPAAPTFGAAAHAAHALVLAGGVRELGIVLPAGSPLLEDARAAYAHWTRVPDSSADADGGGAVNAVRAVDALVDDLIAGEEGSLLTASAEAAGLIKCARFSAETAAASVSTAYGRLRASFLEAAPGARQTATAAFVSACLEIDSKFRPDMCHTAAAASAGGAGAAGSKTSSEAKTAAAEGAAALAWASTKTTPASVPVVLVTGAPGSGKERLADVIADRTSDDFDWSVFRAERKDGVGLRARRLVAFLEGVAASPRRRVLIVVPGVHSARDVLRAMGSAGGAAVTDAFHVSTSLACVNARRVHRFNRPEADEAEDLQFLPGITEQCRKGWATHLVIFGAGGRATGGSGVARAVRDHLQTLNPDAEFLFPNGLTLSDPAAAQAASDHNAAPSPGAASSSSSSPSSSAGSSLPAGCLRQADVLMAREEMVSVVEAEAFGAAQAVEARRFETLAYSSNGNSATVPGHWQSASLSMWGSLHQARFITALRALTKPVSPTATAATEAAAAAATAAAEPKKARGGFMARMQAKARAKVVGVDTINGGFAAVKMPGAAVASETWFVDALVTFVEHPGRWFRCQASRGQVWCRAVESAAPPAASADARPQLHFLFMGPNVSTHADGQRSAYTGAVRDMLQSCLPPLPVNKPARSRQLVTAAEIKALDEQNKTMSAGDGWYYDGRNYVGPTGEARASHPRIEDFIAGFLEAENTAVDKYNAGVAARRARVEGARRGTVAESPEDLAVAAQEEAARIAAANGDATPAASSKRIVTPTKRPANNNNNNNMAEQKFGEMRK